VTPHHDRAASHIRETLIAFGKRNGKQCDVQPLSKLFTTREGKRGVTVQSLEGRLQAIEKYRDPVLLAYFLHHSPRCKSLL